MIDGQIAIYQVGDIKVIKHVLNQRNETETMWFSHLHHYHMGPKSQYRKPLEININF